MNRCLYTSLHRLGAVTAILFLTACVTGGATGPAGYSPGSATAFPWSPVGLVELSLSERKVFCSGALIGERVALTAASCLADFEAGRYPKPEAVQYYAGLSDGRFVARSGVTQMVPSAHFDIAKGAGPNNLSQNWALLILQEPIGLQAGYLGIRFPDFDPQSRTLELADGETVLIAGYPAPAQGSWRLELDRKCGGDAVRLIGPTGDLGHGCRNLSGDSGAPILIEEPGGAVRIIAVNGAANVPLTNGERASIAVNLANLKGILSRAVGSTQSEFGFDPDQGSMSVAPQ